ncbi:MAG: hypothetical protein KF832_00880 [Caldilineaceae bacterium]|nr:hypothetical protein [Caldilineaceae bacterium]
MNALTKKWPRFHWRGETSQHARRWLRIGLFGGLLGALLFAAACRPTPGKPAVPTTIGQPEPALVTTPRPTVAVLPAAPTPPLPPPTLADLWKGDAHFVLEMAETGLPMGESDTLIAPNGEWWSYVHASERSAGVVDQCGAPVAFPGCVVIYRSDDQGLTFRHDEPPICQIACQQCPCTAETDHIVQQQYPRVIAHDGQYWMVYEYQGRVMLRQSADGLSWSTPTWLADSLIWHLWYANCPAEERIGEHPFVPFNYECLRGGPPGLWIEEDTLYVFMAQGQNPGAMGCFARDLTAATEEFVPCRHNPLFVGSAEYGPLDRIDAGANAYFDFRTISSAEVIKVGTGEAARFYLLYEGVRGPAAGAPGDTQFALGLARSRTTAIDGPWEKYPNNPLLVDMPGNIGLGHADVVILEGITYLYTSLDGIGRSRLRLAWSTEID